jgi:hypothetical protein
MKTEEMTSIRLDRGCGGSWPRVSGRAGVRRAECSALLFRLICCWLTRAGGAHHRVCRGHSAPRALEQQACIPASDRSRDPGWPRRAIGARNIVARRSVAANASRLLPILAHKVWGREYLRARSLAVAFSRAIPIGTPADASGRHAERK